MVDNLLRTLGTFLSLGFIVFIQMLLPAQNTQLNFVELMLIDGTAQSYILYVVYYFAIAIVAPFYVAGGFMAYLNRRVVLEGWDIDLGFSKWRQSFIEKAASRGFSNTSNNISSDTTQELQTQKSTLASRPLNALILLVGTGMLYSTLFANTVVFAQSSSYVDSGLRQTDFSLGLDSNAMQSTEPVDDIASQYSTMQGYENAEEKGQENAQGNEQKTKQETKKITAAKQPIRDNLEAVLAAPPFAQFETLTRYRFKSRAGKEARKVKEAENTRLENNFIAKLTKLFAGSVEVLLWALASLFIGYLVFKSRAHVFRLFTNARSKSADKPLPSFISSVFTEDLNHDVVFIVDQCINDKDYRRALSILVRASFTALSDKGQVLISKSMTENECLSSIKRSCDVSIYLYMQSLLHVWMKMAWAHQLPNASLLQTLNMGYQLNFVDSNVSHAQPTADITA